MNKTFTDSLGSIRTEAAPRRTITAYKLMRLVGGKLYPLYIDRSEPVELGVWYNADSVSKLTLDGLQFGYHLIDLETEQVIDSRQKKPTIAEVKAAAANGQRWFYIVQQKTKIGYKNVGIAESNGEEQVKNEYALRPGWHCGSLPVMNQIGKGPNRNLRDDSFVWTEIEISADYDYNDEAKANGGELYYIPHSGYYEKCTNANKAAAQADKMSWYIAGAIKINRIISDREARQIIDRYNRQHRTNIKYDYPRESGKMFNADTMSLEGTKKADTMSLEGLDGRRVYGGNSGYYGYSKSKRAVDAENRGLRSKTQMDTEFANEVNELIKAENPNAKNVTLAQIKKHLDNIHADEWHHTSKFGNQTNYYSAERVARHFIGNNENETKGLIAKEDIDKILDYLRTHTSNDGIGRYLASNGVVVEVHRGEPPFSRAYNEGSIETPYAMLFVDPFELDEPQRSMLVEALAEANNRRKMIVEAERTKSLFNESAAYERVRAAIVGGGLQGTKKADSKTGGSCDIIITFKKKDVRRSPNLVQNEHGHLICAFDSRSRYASAITRKPNHLSGANLDEISELQKKIDEKIKQWQKADSFSVDDFMLFVALELRLRASKKNDKYFSYYLALYDKGDKYVLRISDHHYDASTAEATQAKHTTSLTFSHKETEDWDVFKADTIMRATEYVYYEDKVTKDDLINIAKDIVSFVETGKFKPSVEPNEIHESPDAIYSTEFKRWFGDWERNPQAASKVMRNGKPLVVYHGTTDGGFSKFDKRYINCTEDGFWFTNSYKLAREYSLEDNEPETEAEDSEIYKVYLNMRNPIVLDAKGQTFEKMEEEIYYATREESADGVIVKNIVDAKFNYSKTKPATTYFVKNANQIKAATANNGNFSPESDNILEGVSGTQGLGYNDWDGPEVGDRFVGQDGTTYTITNIRSYDEIDDDYLKAILERNKSKYLYDLTNGSQTLAFWAAKIKEMFKPVGDNQPAKPTADEPQPQPQTDEKQLNEARTQIHGTGTKAFAEALSDRYNMGEKFDWPKAKKMAETFKIASEQEIMQACELAVVLSARQIAHNGQSIAQRFSALKDLYDQQVTVRPLDTKGRKLQQYSTPCPLAFLLGSFVNQGDGAKWYLEPSAGNGMLTIALPKNNTTVNDIDEIRFNNLKVQGFEYCTNQDATKPIVIEELAKRKFHGIITNPPFGKLNDKDKIERHGWAINTLDYKMSVIALDQMTDHGRAAIIVGGKMWDSYWKPLSERSQKKVLYGQWKTFLGYLYAQYNVVDVVYINGDNIYRKQGTQYPIVAILIDGRHDYNEAVKPNYVFDPDRDVIIDTYDQLFDRLMPHLQPGEAADNDEIDASKIHFDPDGKTENADVDKIEKMAKELYYGDRLRLARAKAKALLLYTYAQSNTLRGKDTPKRGDVYTLPKSWARHDAWLSNDEKDAYDFYSVANVSGDKVAVINESLMVTSVYTLKNFKKMGFKFHHHEDKYGTIGGVDGVDDECIERIENLHKAADTINKWVVQNKNGTFNIKLPQFVENEITQAIGRAVDVHKIDSKGIRHSIKNHGIKGKKVEPTDIPVRDEYYMLIPYIMVSPDFVEKGSADIVDRESVRFVKRLSNGDLIVVEKESLNDPNVFETVNMWGKLSDVVNVPKNPNIHVRNVPISTSDIAKIIQDAEMAIIKDKIK